MSRAEFVKPTPAAPVRTFPSGSTLLDLVLGGGWALGRVAVIAGNYSAGKTLLALEACANFGRIYDPLDICYDEPEHALYLDYAHSLGFPKNAHFLNHEETSATIEEFDAHLDAFLAERSDSNPCLYVLDSLDATPSSTELKREFGTATYGTDKAKAMSELFRRRCKPMSSANCALILIAQLRDKIGVMFGETQTHGGGRAIDYYASQMVWCNEAQKIERQVSGVKRVVGAKIRVRNKKNKIGKPFRQAEFQIYFNYGIDDELSNIDWLEKNKLGAADNLLGDWANGAGQLPKLEGAIKDARGRVDRSAIKELSQILRKAVYVRWNEIEDALEPPIRKYEDAQS